MTAAGTLLAEEIRRNGPVPFRRFMEVALYHPEHGYYRRARDPFGAHDPFGVAGDFFTAEQLQPVFGILMAARLRQLYREMGEPPEFTVVVPTTPVETPSPAATSVPPLLTVTAPEGDREPRIARVPALMVVPPV